MPLFLTMDFTNLLKDINMVLEYETLELPALVPSVHNDILNDFRSCESGELPGALTGDRPSGAPRLVGRAFLTVSFSSCCHGVRSLSPRRVARWYKKNAGGRSPRHVLTSGTACATVSSVDACVAWALRVIGV